MSPLRPNQKTAPSNDKTIDANHRFLEAVDAIDMSKYMPTGKIKLGQKGNPLWQLAAHVLALVLAYEPDSAFLEDSVYDPPSSDDDLIFSRWYKLYPQYCRETGLELAAEEDLWMMWLDILAIKVQPENGVKLAADLAQKQPFPTDAELFEGFPKMQLIVATLVMLARITGQGGWITFTYEQLGDAIGLSGETAGTYISRLQKMRSPLLCRIKQGKKTVPSEYLLLSPEILSWTNLPDSKKDIIKNSPRSPQLDYAIHLLRRHPETARK
jgi:hypothetical protein